MEQVLEQGLAILSGSALFRFLASAIPVSITVAAIAGWRSRVEGAGPLAVFGIIFCLWLVIPLHPSLPETRQLSLMTTILCWFWLVWGWGKHVFREWPSPIWGHWIVGTLLWVLPVTSAVLLYLG